jgi:hypothetical protein
MSSEQSVFTRRWAIVEPAEEPTWATEDLSVPPANNDRLPSEPLPPGKRASFVFGRFLIAFCIGVAATLAWQSFGDAVRGMIASSFPQLSWLAPSPAQVAEAPVARPPYQEELKAVSFGLTSVRQRIDQIAAGQEHQEQMTRDLAIRLQATEQDILDKISLPQPRPAIAPARKPAAPAPLPLMPPEAQLVR